MGDDMAAMPLLRAEDDGFLKALKIEVIDPHLETLDFEGCETFDECVERLLEGNADCVDRGSSLPLYLPWRDDEGVLRASSARPVWSGAHVGIPLYGDLCPDGVENLIMGSRRVVGRLSEEFLRFSPAFRVALIVHRITQVVLIDPLDAEAFVLGRYGELPLDDAHYEKVGVPSTELVRVEPNSGSRTEWVMRADGSLTGTLRSATRTNGWRVRVRGSQPKEVLMVEVWRRIREALDVPEEMEYTRDGKRFRVQRPAPSGRRRRRASDPGVDLLFRWCEGRIADGTFPMRGSHKDWGRAAALFGEDCPNLAGRWSSDAMRKAFERRRRNG